MEIENWLYHKLGYPQIEIIGEVAAPLSKKKFPDWIHETALFPKNSVKNCSPADGDDIKIIVKGGCDLLQIQNYLLRGSLFDSEVNYVSENGYRINCSHIEILKQCNQSTIEHYGPIIDRIRFFDRNAFRTKFLSNDHNVYIYSALDNYVRGLYRYRNTDFIIPFGNFNSDLTDESTWAYHSRRSEKHYLDIDFLKWFKNNFTFLGPMDPDAFKLSIAWLRSSISPDKLLIILNGSEVEYIKNDENKRWEHHRKMNQALDNVVNKLPHVAVCDVRKFVKNSSDHSHNIRHYTRRVYFRIAQNINETIQENCNAQSDFCLRQLNLMKYFLKITGQSNKKRFYKKHILQR